VRVVPEVKGPTRTARESHSRGAASSKQERNQREHEEDEKQDFRHTGCASSQPTEAKDRRK
jgi:hypothetical protein